MVIEDIRARFPEWRIWRTAEGNMIVATRLRTLTDTELSNDLRQTIIADDPKTLDEELRIEYRREKTAAWWSRLVRRVRRPEVSLKHSGFGLHFRLEL